MDTVDRDDIIQNIDDGINEYLKNNAYNSAFMRGLMDVIYGAIYQADYVPYIVPTTASWIENEQGNFVCSGCGEEAIINENNAAVLSPCCPFCGSVMTPFETDENWEVIEEL